ncbi:PREDICTED: uncharacterized protein LOC105367651 [Ceratosolen solmsi marchali]|uniref:Uncharacterized protein LOC105367651 n=1 Tax=Ceratosolen solmsi marchali TaxID=326594 RepID=A0AAJ6YUS6_9HYME|nr:PREDICTED: uncharacterized protein LOC105367651 [Ceratosolen solmsi marchali]
MATIQDSKLDLLLTPRVPQGLAAAVESLTREVIRHQPENIYVFAANHFEKLLRLREQYGNDTVKKKNMKFLLDLNDTIKKRQVKLESKERNNSDRCYRWSLNETANVLEKHRSIFGEEGKKISTTEIRALASASISMPSKIQYNTVKKKYETHQTEKKNSHDKYATTVSSKKKKSLHHHSPDLSNTSTSDSRSVPKIIPQIPLVKDIKTELKKNRISSRERKRTVEEKRMQVSCDYIKETLIEKTFRKSIEKTKKNFESQSEQKKNLYSGSSIKRKPDITHKVDSQKIKKSSRTPKMDGVRNYVVQNLIGMASLDELQTASYVEKVQEVIDETSMIIKEKVEALKTSVIEAAKAKQLNSENPLNNDDYFNILRKSADNDNKSSDKNLFENSSYQNTFKNSSFTNIIQDNSDNSESIDNVSLPAVRPPSSKSTSRSLSSRSDSDDLILPPISPESNKSTKVVEKLVLPILSPPRSTSITPDSINCNENIVTNKTTNNDEVFHDSLNVTPDLIDETQKSDYLETLEFADKNDNSERPLENLKNKLLEIEKVQRRIENVLDDTVNISDKNIDEVKESHEIKDILKIEDKLLEIEESEKRIEKILDCQTASVNQSEIINNTNIKSKLQELEDTERRIENIFIDKRSIDEFEMIDNDNEQKNITEYSEKHEISNENNNNTPILNIDDNDLTKNNAMLSEENWNLSPNSFILSEGSPYEIPDFVTTVIIPERDLSPDSDTLQIEVENGKIYSTLVSSKEKNDSQIENCSNELQDKQKISINDAFGEVVNTVNTDMSMIDVNFIRGIKYDIIAPRQSLDLIHEERDKETEDADCINSEDEEVLKVVTSSLDEILKKNKVEYVSKEEIELTMCNTLTEEASDLSKAMQVKEYETNETREISAEINDCLENTESLKNSLDIEESSKISIESSNEIKDTSVTTDRSSLPFDPARPLVPELNLDSLLDLTISSFNLTDDEQKEENKNESQNFNSLKIHTSPTEDTNKKGNFGNFDREALQEKSSIEGKIKDVDKIQNSPLNIIETLKEDYSLNSETVSSECIQILNVENSEHLQDDHYEKLQESLNYNESEAIEDDQIFNETYVIENEHTLNDSNDQTELDVSISADDSINRGSETVNTYEIEETTLGTIDDTCSEIQQNKELIVSTCECRTNVLDDQLDDAERSLTELTTHLIEQDCQCEIDNDQHNQFIDSSNISNQSVNQLDSDILTMTGTNNILSQDLNTLQEQKATTNNAHNNDFKVTEEKIVISEERVENIQDTIDDKEHRQIYGSEVSTSKDGSSVASSTLLSAVTKIQAGIRGYLTRCRLERSLKRCSSTLDSIPSIEDSFPVSKGILLNMKSISSSSHTMPIVDDVSSILQSKERKKLRRETAVQKTAYSLETAFANNQLQHTGEFHDCLPLPIFDTRTFFFTTIEEQNYQEIGNTSLSTDKSKKKSLDSIVNESKECNNKENKESIILHREALNSTDSGNVEQVLGKVFTASATHLSAQSNLGQFGDVALLPADSETILQNRYLNFITSVEDVVSNLFNDPLMISNSSQSVIIDEITRFDEAKSKICESVVDEAKDKTTINDAAKEKKAIDEYFNAQLQSRNIDEKSNKCTSNIIEITASPSSDVETKSYAENSGFFSDVPADVGGANAKSFRKNEPIGEISDKVISFYETTRNEDLESKERLSLEIALTSSTDELISINIEEALGLCDKNNGTRKTTEQSRKSFTSNLSRSASDSRGSNLEGNEKPSPATIMKTTGESVVEKRVEKSELSDDEKNESVVGDGTNKKSSIERDSSLTDGENSSAQGIKGESQ